MFGLINNETNADDKKAKELAEALAKQELHRPQKPAVLSVSQLCLPADAPGGHTATLTEAMHRAAAIEAEQRQLSPAEAIVVSHTPSLAARRANGLGTMTRQGKPSQQSRRSRFIRAARISGRDAARLSSGSLASRGSLDPCRRCILQELCDSLRAAAPPVVTRAASPLGQEHPNCMVPNCSHFHARFARGDGEPSMPPALSTLLL